MLMAACGYTCVRCRVRPAPRENTKNIIRIRPRAASAEARLCAPRAAAPAGIRERVSRSRFANFDLICLLSLQLKQTTAVQYCSLVCTPKPQSATARRKLRNRDSRRPIRRQRRADGLGVGHTAIPAWARWCAELAITLWKPIEPSKAPKLHCASEHTLSTSA